MSCTRRPIGLGVHIDAHGRPIAVTHKASANPTAFAWGWELGHSQWLRTGDVLELLCRTVSAVLHDHTQSMPGLHKRSAAIVVVCSCVRWSSCLCRVRRVEQAN